MRKELELKIDMKATAIAPSNIAFIKYWGVKDAGLRLPTNGSISMNLSGLLTTTTVEFNQDLEEDIVIIGNKDIQREAGRVSSHLDRVRRMAKIKTRAKVVSINNFPISTGLSSSASGFAALTVAASNAAAAVSNAVGLQLSGKKLSILARLGSGSACRSIPDGFVEWIEGDSNETSYAVSLYPPDYWDIVDIVVIISREKKEISSSEGQRLALTSPFFSTRLSRIQGKIDLLKKYLRDKNFTAFGELIEAEALELHSIYLTSVPPLIYLRPETLSIMQRVKKWREAGLSVYFTLNTGQDIHLICQKSDQVKVQEQLASMPEVKRVIVNYPSKGAWLTTEHLF